MTITILGGGSWGTALAVHLARKGDQIRIWEFFEEQAKEMQNNRVCPLLPGTKLPNNITVTSEMGESLANTELVLLVVPSDKVESTINTAKEYITNQSIIICSKGFGPNLQLLSDLVKDNVSGQVYCLYGPTHAEEVCKGMFSGIVLAGGSGKEKLRDLFESGSLRVDLSEDIIGVQVGAALKNIVAVFVGVLDGMKLGDNAKAYVITKGLGEIRSIGLRMGAQEETFDGLAGLGDLIVTCSSKHSRNRHVGEEVGKGKKLDDVIKEMKMVAEGVTTVREAVKFEEKLSIKLPLMSGLYSILFEGKSPTEILKTI
jgi:glycerol-3-phosphate dehydrogenase (NAD(P)+)